jgi:hypothetical protein
MIFSSILFCAVLPIIIRLSIARRRHRLELQEIACSTPDVFLNLQLIYQNIQINNIEDIDSHEHSIIYSQIPFIDDLNKEDDTFV